MGFKTGFEKVAFLPLVAGLGRLAIGGLARGAMGAGRLGLKAGGKAVGLGVRAAGGPLNAAFTAADIAGQTSEHLKDLKSLYR